MSEIRSAIKDLRFSKTTVGVLESNNGGYPMNTFHAVGDVNGDGRPDIVVGARQGRMIWLENRGPGAPFAEHLVDDTTTELECGGSLVDLTGDGRLDIICGSGGRLDELWWWENPGPAGGAWRRRTILKTGHTQFHDTLIGDPRGEGRPALVVTNQHGPGGTVVYAIPLPTDPRRSPWPDVMVVAQGLSEALVGPHGGAVLKMQPEEGLAIGDVDGDGRNEIVCGTHWFRYDGAAWKGHKFASGYVTTKVAIGDVDGDGRNEIVLAEGDPCIYGKTQGGKVAWFRPGSDIHGLWMEHILEDSLLDAHTLALGDLTGNPEPTLARGAARRHGTFGGALDIVVGEIGVASPERGYAIRPPRILAFENDGAGHFTRRVIDDGTGIHDGVLWDMRGDGKLDLVGKPLHGPERWHIHAYYNQSV